MIDRNHPRYLAVYGAAVARQAFDRMDRGLGPADDDLMARFVEEAHAVAEHSEEQQPHARATAEQASRDRVLGAAVRSWKCPRCHHAIELSDLGFVTTCAHCGPLLKTFIANLIAAESKTDGEVSRG